MIAIQTYCALIGLNGNVSQMLEAMTQNIRDIISEDIQEVFINEGGGLSRISKHHYSEPFAFTENCIIHLKGIRMLHRIPHDTLQVEYSPLMQTYAKKEIVSTEFAFNDYVLGERHTKGMMQLKIHFRDGTKLEMLGSGANFKPLIDIYHRHIQQDRNTVKGMRNVRSNQQL